MDTGATVWITSKVCVDDGARALIHVPLTMNRSVPEPFPNSKLAVIQSGQAVEILLGSVASALLLVRLSAQARLDEPPVESKTGRLLGLWGGWVGHWRLTVAYAGHRDS